MSTDDVYVGIDPASESFTATLYHDPQHFLTAPHPFANTPEGIDGLLRWLESEGVSTERIVACVENTGVYSEVLCYSLHERGVRISLLEPRRVWKAFPDGHPKNDPLDSRKIAEYGFRYADQLSRWTPQEVVVEQVQVILATREQLVEQKTAIGNARSTLARKVVQTPAANRALETTLEHLQHQIRALEAELKELIRSHPTLIQGVNLLLSAPGVGWLLSAHFLVLTDGFREIPPYRRLAQYLGIAPNEHSSGKTVRRRTRSRRYGPSAVRKLLHLAARSLRTHEPAARKYFLEKTAEGKPKTLVLNNLANKLVKRLCAMLRDRKPYVPRHRSVDPRLLALV
jgi:transposase